MNNQEETPTLYRKRRDRVRSGARRRSLQGQFDDLFDLLATLNQRLKDVTNKKGEYSLYTDEDIRITQGNIKNHIEDVSIQLKELSSALAAEDN